MSFFTAVASAILAGILTYLLGGKTDALKNAQILRVSVSVAIAALFGLGAVLGEIGRAHV